MKRRRLMLGAVALLAAMISMLSAHDARAQCCRVGFRIASDVCPLTLCIITPEGRICHSFVPGDDSTVAVRCDMPITIGIQDVCGRPHVIAPDSCEDNIFLGHTCCVKVCLRHDPATGCLRVTVERATGPCTCP